MTNRINFMIHAGGKVVDLEQVVKVATPDPIDRWYPIPHISLIEQVRKALEATGLVVQAEAHALAGKDLARYFGYMQVGNPDQDQDDHAMVVGLRNSHDKAFAAALAVGAGVFVCDNLAFSSDIVIGRKHTRNIVRDLNGLVHRAVSRLTEHRNLLEARYAAYKGFEMSDDLVDHLVCEMYRAGVLTTQKIGPVLNEWNAPRHPEFVQAGKTGWRLFNGVTEVLKGRMATLAKETMTLHGIMDQATGVYDTLPKAA